MTNRTLLITASFLGMTSIVLGAFGAHGLKALVSFDALQSFEIGVKYQMYHALLLLFVGSTPLVPLKAKKTIFYLIVLGLFFFSGSIYGLATNDLSGFDFKNIAFITPIGGLMLILAWVILGVGFLKNK